MKRYYFLFVFGGLFFLASCKQTCENVKVGETELAASTKNFLKYNQGDKISFISNSGTLINLEVSRESSNYFICQKTTCDPLDPYKSSYCEYIEAPQESIFLSSDSTLIAIEASVFAYEPETELLYDAVRFTLSHVNSTTFASHITDVKFTSPEFNRSEIVDIDNFMSEEGEVKLREKTYKNVLTCKEAGLALYFTASEGIIGFEVNDQLYTPVN
ncbi:hypothetical protein [Portibacter marinus]|uniref:hypothetical protein n=1 Tax=Portibacter marinus TaxID=2898660 RepID=UPI001F38560B|nr:hypothetical protein [Portibacter marinus]